MNMAPSLSAGARMADSRLLRVCSSGVGQGFFVGVSTPIPAPWKVILGVSWVISGRRYDDGPPPWGSMSV